MARESERRDRVSHNAAGLLDLRRRIDQIDAWLVRLLNERAQTAISVGRIKRAQGRAMFDAARERAVLKQVAQAGQGPLSPRAMQQIFHEVLRQSRRLESSARPRSPVRTSR